MNLMNYIGMAKTVGRSYYFKGLRIGLKGFTAQDFENHAIIALFEAA